MPPDVSIAWFVLLVVLAVSGPVLTFIVSARHADTVERLLQHLQETQVVGGTPRDLAVKAHELATQRQAFEEKKLEIERERLAARRKEAVSGAFNPEG